MSTRRSLLDALSAIANARSRVTFKTGFAFLARYMSGTGKAKDKELAKAFKAAAEAMSRGKKRN
jgi:hypothetical protein